MNTTFEILRQICNKQSQPQMGVYASKLTLSKEEAIASAFGKKATLFAGEFSPTTNYLWVFNEALKGETKVDVVIDAGDGYDSRFYLYEIH
jgi:hypothetical protein